MNKFKKKTRSKMIAASIAILSSAAVVSTGFAAWVISGGDSKEAAGNITADTVINSIHTVTLDTTGNDGKVFFGAPQVMDNSSAWLKNNATSADQKEDLTATFGFTVAGLEKNVKDTKPSDLFDSKKFILAETTTDDDASKKYSTYAAADKNYLAALPSFDFSTKTAYDTAAKKNPGIYLVPGDFAAGSNGNYGTQHFTVTIQFGWGSKFGGENPYLHYNTTEMANSSGARSEALTALSELKEIKASFKLTIATL